MLTAAFPGLSALKRNVIDNNLREVQERNEYNDCDYDDEGPDVDLNAPVITLDPHEGCGRRSVAILMQALASSGIRIGSFKIRSDNHDFAYPDGFARVSVTDMIGSLPAVVRSCQKLKELELLSIFYNEQEARDVRSLRPTFGLKYTSSNASNQAMQSMLGCAASVKKLSLFCVDYIGYPCIITESTVPLNTLMVSNKLLNLRGLNISTFKTQQHELVGFLKLCAPTLRSLRLQNIHSIRGNCLAAVRSLKGLFNL